MPTSHIGMSEPRTHLKLVPPGRRTTAATPFRGSVPIRATAHDWSVDLSCRSGCLVVAPNPTPPTVFWAGVLLPLLRTFAGPVVLDTSRGNVDASAVADLAFTGRLPRRPDRARGHLRVVVAPADLSRARRELGPAGIEIFESLPDATHS